MDKPRSLPASIRQYKNHIAAEIRAREAAELVAKDATMRADLAERQVRDLTAALDRAHRRADALEAELRSTGRGGR